MASNEVQGQIVKFDPNVRLAVLQPHLHNPLAGIRRAEPEPLTESPIVDPVEVVAVVFITLAGLAIGSFLNVVIWRVPRGESIVSPPSHCPQCDAEIRGRDNIPVLSWLILRGRCRDCGAHISARYPGVELLTGALFLLVTLTFGLTWELPAYLYLTAVGVALAFIDLDTKRLPNVLTLPSYPIVAGLLLIPAAVYGQWGDFGRALLGGLGLFVFYLLLALVYPAGMGMGDVKLSGVLGMALAWLGWGEWLVGSFLAFLLGCVRRPGHDAVPRRRAEVRHPVRPLHAGRGASGHPPGAGDRRLVRGSARRLTALPGAAGEVSPANCGTSVGVTRSSDPRQWPIPSSAPH